MNPRPALAALTAAALILLPAGGAFAADVTPTAAPVIEVSAMDGSLDSASTSEGTEPAAVAVVDEGASGDPPDTAVTPGTDDPPTAAPAAKETPTAPTATGLSTTGAESAVRRIGGRDADQRCVTVIDETVVCTGFTARGTPVTGQLIADLGWALAPTIAGAAAGFTPDGSIAYTPAPGWSGVDQVQVVSAGDNAPMGAWLYVYVNPPAPGLDNNLVGGAFPVKPNQDGDIVMVIGLDQTRGGEVTLPNGGFPAGVAYATTSGGAAALPGYPQVELAAGLLWYVADGDGWTGDTVEVTVWDEQGDPATATVVLTLAQPAEIVPDRYLRVAQDSGPVTLNLLGNDALPNGVGNVTVSHPYLIDAATGEPSAVVPDLRVVGPNVVFTPPTGFTGHLALQYAVTDPVGDPVEVWYGGTVADVRVAIGYVPLTYSDGQALGTPGEPADRANRPRVSAEVPSKVDVLANDDLRGTPLELVATGVPAAWTATVTDDLQLEVTAPVADVGKASTVHYQVRTAAGWSGRESAVIEVDRVQVQPVRPAWFAWAGTTSMVLDPTVGNDAALAAAGTVEVTLLGSLQQRPVAITEHPDGTLTVSPSAGFTGDVPLAWSATDASGAEVAQFEGVLHVLGPVARDWNLSIPQGATGRVDDLLDGVLYGTEKAMNEYIDELWLWDNAGGVRSRTVEGVVSEPQDSWPLRERAVDPGSIQAVWPTSTVSVQLVVDADPTTFTGRVALAGRSLEVASDVVQVAAVQGYVAVSEGGASGPVARVVVDVTPVTVPPPPPADPPSADPPVADPPAPEPPAQDHPDGADPPVPLLADTGVSLAGMVALVALLLGGGIALLAARDVTGEER